MYQYQAQVVSIYDGDTITLDIDLGCSIRLKGEKCRLFGINTPEVRGPEKPEGLVARDALRAKILGKEITIKTYKDKTGKYGRLLVEVFSEDININEWLVAEGLGVVASY